jgi:lipid-A-disaccharide synthase
MTLLPNEGRWFDKYGLRSDFVGHPVVERVGRTGKSTRINGYDKTTREVDRSKPIDPGRFRAANAIPADATVISVLPGSRHSETKRLIPILKEAVERLSAEDKKICVVVPTVPGVEREVRHGFRDFPLPVRIVIGEENRYNAFVISKLALAKSGTVSLELASFGVPHLIAYTFGPLSNVIAKRLVKVRFANLINLLANREIIPEFGLDRCRPELSAECAKQLLHSPQEADRQIVEANEVMKKLSLPDILPSDRAAQIVSEVAGWQLDHPDQPHSHPVIQPHSHPGPPPPPPPPPPKNIRKPKLIKK